MADQVPIPPHPNRVVEAVNDAAAPVIPAPVIPAPVDQVGGPVPVVEADNAAAAQNPPEVNI